MIRFAPVFLALISTADAQIPVNDVLETLSNNHKVEELSVSADGRRVAWEQDALYWRDIASGIPRRISVCSGKCREGGAAWSADGARLAFLSDAEERGQQQLYVVVNRGHEAGEAETIDAAYGTIGRRSLVA